MAARSKAWVCDRSFAGIEGSDTVGGTDVCCGYCVLSGRCSVTGRSLIQRSPSERTCVSECAQVQQ
jgi:hypothetical protein